MRLLFLLFAWAITCLFSVANPGKSKLSKRTRADSTITQIIDQFNHRFAPDKRTAIFQIDAYQQKGQLILTGKTNLIGAKSFLLERLKAEKLEIIDQIKTLPSPDLGGKTWGLVEVSVCNIRYSPRHSGEMASQALMGTPVRILEREDNGWLLIQTPDNYIAWVDRGAITGITTSQYEQWKAKAKVIFTRSYGFVYSEPNEDSQTVSDMVAGCIVELKAENDFFYEVLLPDNRLGYIAKKEASMYNNWVSNLKITDDALVKTAKRLMGVPYLWGGTSFKGVDCSGFTKTVYFLNGILLPRDASQQVMIGETIDKNGNWGNLKEGDLLFFGEKREDGSERVVHVGMWIGNNEFIHASDKVRIGSMNPSESNYDEYNSKRYLRAKRILKTNMQGLIKLKPNGIYQ
jgi:SH3-like domain-containing protein